MGRSNLIRVGIADDYPVVLRGVESILAPCSDMVLSFAAESIAQLMDGLTHSPVDVLLCDYAFDDDPQADGLNLLRKIRRHAPEMRVIFLSAHALSHIISGALELGAAGFIGKNKTDFVNLPQAVRSVYAGNIYLPQSLSALLLEQIFTHQAGQVGLQSLSERESAVARMICEGLSIRAIAQRLHRSPKTISNQKVAAMKKLGVSNDVELSRVFRDLNE
ncbi:response regulator transcription factor [Herbaspirillum sp. CF444]|uniref:response regulator transcription factor n=1 Tax=Herbaspirillum sp. CF444 TaxID=1144319 RepID=UPI00068A59CD|nr:response regulator transcription factor [Herbaspirillum sp. CF444]